MMKPQLACAASETNPAVESQDAAAEANHRIANSLSIIAQYVRSELASLDQEEPRDWLSMRRLLEQLSLRIDAIARLHRLLTSSSHAACVEICAYLREIVDAARCSLAHPKHIEILPAFDTEASVTAKQAAAIGAIAIEALINSIKYSHPGNEAGTVSLGCRRTRFNRLVVEIKDDGVGQPHEFPAKASQCRGAGNDLMRTLARSLDAKLEIIDGDSGRVVHLELPLLNQSTQ